MDRFVVVTGATGQQGGAVAKHLLAQGWPVRALTRDATAPKARALATAGAEVVEGTFEDEATIDRYLEGAYGLYIVHPGPISPDQDEIRAGKLLADAAAKHDVAHIVYSSALGADRIGGEKWEIEQHLTALGISATILRPSSFMENLYTQSETVGVHSGALRTALAPHIRQQFIALDDIGAIATRAFTDPPRFRARTLELVGDALTPPEVAAKLTAAVGHPVPYRQRSIEDLRRINERFARGYELLNSTDGTIPDVDISELRSLHPDLMNFDTWLQRTGLELLRPLL
ncbi:NmrA/HSCARG family protein [Nocardia sp. NPDC003482]